MQLPQFLKIEGVDQFGRHPRLVKYNSIDTAGLVLLYVTRRQQNQSVLARPPRHQKAPHGRQCSRILNLSIPSPAPRKFSTASNSNRCYLFRNFKFPPKHIIHASHDATHSPRFNLSHWHHLARSGNAGKHQNRACLEIKLQRLRFCPICRLADLAAFKKR